MKGDGKWITPAARELVPGDVATDRQANQRAPLAARRRRFGKPVWQTAGSRTKWSSLWTYLANSLATAVMAWLPSDRETLRPRDVTLGGCALWNLRSEDDHGAELLSVFRISWKIGPQ